MIASEYDEFAAPDLNYIYVEDATWCANCIQYTPHTARAFCCIYSDLNDVYLWLERCEEL